MNNLIKSIYILLAILLVWSCQKEPVTPIMGEGELLFLDSINVDPNNVSVEKTLIDSALHGHIKRNNKTIILSKTLKLNFYPALDFYIPREELEPGMEYTSVMTPISGDPSLNICSYLPTRFIPYRMISSDPKEGVEQLSCTSDVLLENELELNFMVKGNIGDEFHWEIYKEPIPAIDTSIVIPELCLCDEQGKTTLVCENFESLLPGPITNQAAYFIEMSEQNNGDALVVKKDGEGFDASNSYLELIDENANDETQLKLAANFQLGDNTSGSYLLSWQTKIPEDGTASFNHPRSGSKFRLNKSGRSTITILDKYVLNFSIPTSEWFEFNLYFEPARSLYRFQVGNIYYYWRVNIPANQDQQDYIQFNETPSGFKVDDICFSQYNY